MTGFGSVSSQITRRPKGFLGDVIALVSGTTLGQVITLVCLPLLSRIYQPDAFGVFAIFLGITGIGTVVSSLRYELAIVLPEKKKEAANLFIGTLVITLITSVFIGLILWPVWKYITLFLKVADLTPFFWMIPLTILVNGAFQAIGYWCSRERLFGFLSIAKILNAAITAVSQVTVGLLGYTGAGGLIVSVVLGSLASFLIMFVRLFIFQKEFWNLISVSEILKVLNRYRKFPLFDNWAALLNSISWQLPNFFLSFFFSTAQVGYYSIGNRLLRLPMSLVGTSIGQVFFQRAASAQREGKLRPLVTSVFQELVAIGLFPMLLLSLVGKEVFEVGLGSNWAEGGVYTQILSIWMFFWFISSPLSTIFRVLEKQEFSLVLNIVIFVTRFLSLLVGGMYGSIYLALGLFSISGIVLYGYLSLAIVHAAGVPYRYMFKTLFHQFLVFLPVGIIFLFIKLYSDWSPLLLVLLTGSVFLAFSIYNFLKLRKRLFGEI